MLTAGHTARYYEKRRVQLNFVDLFLDNPCLYYFLNQQQQVLSLLLLLRMHYQIFYMSKYVHIIRSLGNFGFKKVRLEVNCKSCFTKYPQFCN